MRCQPRKWTDQFGEMQRDIWDTAVQAVIGHITGRPGQTEVRIAIIFKGIVDYYIDMSPNKTSIYP